MRILSYNILDGGEGRADPLAEVIQAQNPDVVALVEADDLAVVQRIAGRLQMDFVHAVGNRHASALLSRWTIRQSINHAPLHPKLSGSMLEATLIDPQKRILTLGAVHLHPHATESDETHREQELAVILKLFAEHRSASQPHVLLGDFNANSPVQQIDIARCKPRTQREYQANGGQLPRRAIQRLLDAGYVDSLDAADPHSARTAGTFSTQFPGQRVDFIFTFGIDRSRLQRAWIEQDRLAQFASDHFPVGVEIL